MKVNQIKIQDIKPYGNNAKKHSKKQIEQVANSIKRFGFVQPLVVDKNNELIIGHCRLEASKKLGLTEVPVLKVEDLSEEEVKALRLADNKLNESEIVADPFLGSGTTLIASEKTGRICYGMELDPCYVDVIVQRYVDYTGNNKIKLNGKEIIWQRTK